MLQRVRSDVPFRFVQAGVIGQVFLPKPVSSDNVAGVVPSVRGKPQNRLPGTARSIQQPSLGESLFELFARPRGKSQPPLQLFSRGNVAVLLSLQQELERVLYQDAFLLLGGGVWDQTSRMPSTLEKPDAHPETDCQKDSNDYRHELQFRANFNRL